MILHLGCGMSRIAGAVNHDISRHSDHVNIAHDLDVFPWPWRSEEFDMIVAHDVVEHLRCDVQQWMDEAWRILVLGGSIDVRVPSYKHENAFTDPTHRRFFAVRTFDYWDRTKELHHKYGQFYFGASSRWWAIDSAAEDQNGNLCFRMRKDAA
jgi:predicted SAM-dependent methyltransferase